MGQNRGVPSIELFGKAGCCLCDEARHTVQAVRQTHDFDLTEVDITVDPVLHRRYGERIPVLTIDGEEAFEFRVDAEELRSRLDRVGG